MKTILITGSTDGVGKLTATKLAKSGHQILLHGRNAEKLKNTISEIKKETSNNKVSGFIADFSDFNSIEKMIAEISNAFPIIDVLINNAGIFKSPVDKTMVGLDIRFAVNYFAPYILTNGLLSLLKSSKEARIINLSSAAQSTVRIGALNGQATVNESEAYAQSKLALTMWSFAFAKANPKIVTIAVNPGSLLNTRMANEAYGQHWSPATKGSDILYDLAISEEYKDASGNYFDNDKGNPKGHFSKAHSDAYDDEKINQLIIKTKEIIS
jgi:NAD(P)-dependent dehydrogenase (short-subunit alcohol dehydrogenase family)